MSDYVASMKASIVLDKKELRNDIIKGLALSQKELDADKLKVKVTGDVAELNKLIASVQANNPKVKIDLVVGDLSTEIDKIGQDIASILNTKFNNVNLDGLSENIAARVSAGIQNGIQDGLTKSNTNNKAASVKQSGQKNKNKQVIPEDEYSKNYNKWLAKGKQIVDDSYSNVFGAKIAQSEAGVVKFTASVQDATGEWKKFSATVRNDGILIRQTIQDMTGKELSSLMKAMQAVQKGEIAESQALSLDDIAAKSKAAQKALEGLYGKNGESSISYKALVDERGQLSLTRSIKETNGELTTMVAKFVSVDEFLQKASRDAKEFKSYINTGFENASYATRTTNVTVGKKDNTPKVKAVDSVDSMRNKATTALSIVKGNYDNVKELPYIAKYINDIQNKINGLSSADGLKRVLNDIRSLEKACKDAAKGWELLTNTSVKDVMGSYTQNGWKITDKTFNNGEVVKFKAELLGVDNVLRQVIVDAEGVNGATRKLFTETASGNSRATVADLFSAFRLKNKDLIGFDTINAKLTELEMKAHNMSIDELKNKLHNLKTEMSDFGRGFEYTDFNSIDAAMEHYKKLGAKITDIKSSAGQMTQFKASFKDMDGSIKQIIIDAKGAGGAIRQITAQKPPTTAWRSFADQIKRSATYFKNYMSGYMAMQTTLRLVRYIGGTLGELDDAVVDIHKTFRGSNAELEEMYYNSSKIAKQLGVATKEILEQEASWARAGYNTKAQAEEMAKMSSMFASISPDIDTSEADTGLVSIMKAFDIDTTDVKREILDNINEIGNSFAATNGDILTGLKKSSASMAAIGEDINDTIALFTAGQEILQDADIMGNALRSITMRVRGYSEETEELSEDLVNIKGEVADLTKTASDPNGISLFTDASQQHYKTMVQYLGEISDIWNELSEKQQTDLLQKLFGKTRAQAGAAIIKNFDTVRESLKTMEDAEGSADKEMDNIKKSISYNLNELKETWTGVWQELVDRGDIVTVIKLLTRLSEAIAAIVDKTGGIGLAGLIGGAVAGANGHRLTYVTYQQFTSPLLHTDI